jgi:hypothetical protein
VVCFGYGAVLAGAATVAAGLFRALLGSTCKTAPQLSSLPAVEAGNIQE